MRKKIDPKQGNKSEWSTFTTVDILLGLLGSQDFQFSLSDRQLYALQKSICDTSPCNTIEAACCVGKKLVAACVDLNIQEISAYDRNGYAHGEKMQAFEIAISQYGFLPR